MTAVSADIDPVFSLFQHPCALTRIIGSKLLYRERYLDRFYCSGENQVCLVEASQYFGRLGQLRLGLRSKNLHHLFAGDTACVGDGNRHSYPVALHSNRLRVPRKLRIGQTIAKGIAGLYIKAVKPAIPDENSFLIYHIVRLCAVVGGKGIIRILFCPGRGQPAAGVHFTDYYFRNSVSAAAAALAHQHYRAGQFPDALDVHHAAHIQQQHKAVIRFCQQFHIPALRISQQVITGDDLPVRSLTRVAGKDIDRCIRRGKLLLLNRSEFRFLERVSHHGQKCGADSPRGKLLNMIVIFLLRTEHGSFLPGKPRICYDLKAGIFETLLHSHIASCVYIAGAGAALHGASGSAAEQRDGFYIFVQRQYALVFQKNDSFLCDPC